MPLKEYQQRWKFNINITLFNCIVICQEVFYAKPVIVKEQ